jgi:hypothetical protein
MNTYYGIDSSRGDRSGSDFESSTTGSRDRMDKDSGLGTRDSTFDTRNSSNSERRESGLGTSSSRIDSGDSKFESRSKPDSTDKHNLL